MHLGIIGLLSAFLFLSSFSFGGDLKFVRNDGQWNDKVLYHTDISGGRLFFEEDRLTYNFVETLHDHTDHHDTPEPINGHAYQVTFVNGKIKQAKGLNKLKEYHNYFLGNDKKRWAGKVPLFSGLYYYDVWGGIDMKFYSKDGSMKYDIIIPEGEDHHQIKLKYDGVESIRIVDGNLVIKTSLNEIQELAPYAYQMSGCDIIRIECNYVLKNGELTFEFPNGYKTGLPLIIDPATLIFSTYSGSTADNWGYTATYDRWGHHYAGGIANGAGYPTTTGSYQELHAGGTGSFRTDVTLTKFELDGAGLEWSTYLGGSETEIPLSLFVDNFGSLVMLGATSSNDFPTTTGAFDTTFAGGTGVTVTSVVNFSSGSDIFVTRFSIDGSALVGSTYFGGTSNDGLNEGSALHHNYGDHARGEIVLDPDGNIYIASCTESSDIYTSTGVLQDSFAGGLRDGLVVKFGPDLTSVNWSTLYGGVGADACYSLALDEKNNIFITGGTTSNDLLVSTGAWNNSYQGGSVDGFVIHLKKDGKTMLNGTYVGTSSYDQSYFVKLDRFEEVYIVGQSEGSMPVTSGVYSNAGSGLFITKLRNDLTGVEYSTVIGSGSGKPNITPTAFLVDICQNVYVSGWGGSVNFAAAGTTTTGCPVTSDAFQTTTDGSDFYLCVLETDALSLKYATFFGGSGVAEHVDGGTSRFDKDGIVYQTVCAGCGGSDLFPTTTGAWSETNESSNCNVGAFKLEIDLSTVDVEVFADPLAIGCPPLTVDFVPDTNSANNFIWDFGDGTPISTDTFPTHVYMDTGTYIIRLIGIDSMSCNFADTAYSKVVVKETYVNADFTQVELGQCDSISVNFNATSSGLAPEYLWTFGDGDTAYIEDPSHTFDDTGIYTIRLIVYDSTSCNLADTFFSTVKVLPELEAGYIGALDGCVDHTVFLTNMNTATHQENLWDFGDGDISTMVNPIHIFTNPGTYVISLITIDSLSCNGADTVYQTVNVYDFPIPDFSSAPAAPTFWQPIDFTDLSIGGNSWYWEFGDGLTSIVQNPKHKYAEPGTYTVCLTVSTANDCDSMICKEVFLDSDYLIDIPNAFSPNEDGVNDEFFPIHFGLRELEFNVYNRWGQKLYTTTVQDAGWDGTFNGKPQEVGVYVYTVTGVSFEDEEVFLTGNVTLLR